MWKRLDSRVLLIGIAAVIATGAVPGLAGHKPGSAERDRPGSLRVHTTFAAPNPCVRLSVPVPAAPAGVRLPANAAALTVTVTDPGQPCAAVITRRSVTGRIADDPRLDRVQVFFVAAGGHLIASQAIAIRR